MKVTVPNNPNRMPSRSKVWVFLLFLLFMTTYGIVLAAVPWPYAALAVPPYTVITVVYAKKVYRLGLLRKAEAEADASA